MYVVCIHTHTSQGTNATYDYAKSHGFVPNHLDLIPIGSAYIGIWNVMEVCMYECVYVHMRVQRSHFGPVLKSTFEIDF